MVSKPKQEYPKKIKLKLEQPAIVCGGRERVTCFYRGKIIKESEHLAWIIFVSEKKEVSLVYNKETKTFGDKEWIDLKII